MEGTISMSDIGKLGQEVAKKILKKHGFMNIHDNNAELVFDVERIYLSQTFDFYCERKVREKVVYGYFCSKCRRNHSWGTEIAEKHRKYAERPAWYYTEEKLEKWVIDVKSTITGVEWNKVDLTLKQILLGYILAHHGFRIGILKINLKTRKYQLLDIKSTLLKAVEEIFEEIIKAKKITLKKLGNYAKRRILKEKTILKPTLTTIYKTQAKSIEELCQGIEIFEGQLRKPANT